MISLESEKMTEEILFINPINIQVGEKVENWL